MDNTYDKRISNLEAVITPLLSQENSPDQAPIKQAVQQELAQVVKVMDEKVRKVMQEKDHKIQALEEEVKDLKQIIETGVLNQAAVV